MESGPRVSFEMDSERTPENKIQDMQITSLETGNPPTYTVPSNGSPPSYSSIFGRLKDAKEESSGNFEFGQKAMAIVTCSGACNIAFIILFWIFTLACLGMGAGHNHNCPASPMIPKYLIVFGTFYTIKVLLALMKFLRYLYEKPEDKELPSYMRAVDGLLDCFLFIWFIIGNVYIYRLNGKYQSDDPLGSDYCNRNLYLFAFWAITIQYILALFFICLGCCVFCIFCFCVLNKQTNNVP